MGVGVTLAQHTRDAHPGIHRHPLPPKRLRSELGRRADRWNDARKSKGPGTKEPHAAEDAVRTRQEKQ